MDEITMEAFLEALGLETARNILRHKAEVQQAAAEAAVLADDYQRARLIWKRQAQILAGLSAIDDRFCYLEKSDI